MKTKIKRDRATEKYLENQLTNYSSLLKEYEELSKNIIFKNNVFDGQPRGKSISKTTENKACSLASNKRLIHLERTIAAIKKVLSELPEEKLEFVKYRFWDRRLRTSGLALRFHINDSTVWRWSNAILDAIAIELGMK